MSTNYTCNQFDKAYKPTRLGNWEVPKWHLNRPKGRSTVTKVIANNQGHLLPGVQKVDQKHWAGLYLGTYQLPKRITKEIAKELSNPKCQTWMKRSYHHPFIDRSQQNKKENDKFETMNAKEPSIINDETDNDSTTSIKSMVVRSAVDASSDVASETAGPTNRNGDDGTTDGGGEADGGTGAAATAAVRRGERDVTGAKTPSSPALSRISASGGRADAAATPEQPSGGRADAAATPEQPNGGRRRGDAHKHHGLPDAIEDAVYRSLQMKRDRHPGLGLNGCWPKCSAVAYKSFNDPGPTQCSKLRVYRPKTSEQPDCGQARESRRARPKTCVPVAAAAAERLTDIKLALCWDLDASFDRNRPPPPPPDEPAVFHKVQQPPPPSQSQKPNGRASPPPPPQNSSAVMGFVRRTAVTSADDSAEVRRAHLARQCVLKNRNLSAVMELIPNKDREPTDDTADRTRSNNNNKSTPSSSSSSVTRCKGDRNRSSGTPRPKGGCGDGDRECGGPDDDDNDDDAAAAGSERGRCRRPPQPDSGTQRRVFRPCAACDRPDAGCETNGRSDECDRYKMAFKAGVPVSTPVKNRAAAAAKPARRLKVPKPKTTNSDKKKYVIGTLLPPFSMWPGTTARDYPEHWRLTSVYRQAFKPLELRKQPLLQTVYL